MMALYTITSAEREGARERDRGTPTFPCSEFDQNRAVSMALVCDFRIKVGKFVPTTSIKIVRQWKESC